MSGMYIYAGGKRYKFRYVDPEDEFNNEAHGECDQPGPNREVRVSDKITGDLLLDTCIHEYTHLWFPWLDEDVVEEFATDMTRYLLKVIHAKKLAQPNAHQNCAQQADA